MTTSANCRAAVITPPGEGGISVIELTGPGAVALAQVMFRGKRPADLAGECSAAIRGPGRLHYGHLVKGDEILDEVLVAVIEPGAETQTVEINCHGGIVAVERVMAELEARGAERVDGRAADRGLDVIQREAAAAILQARSRQTVRMLLAQYRGELSRAVRRVAALSLRDAAGALCPLAATARLGMALCDPKRVVIAGNPNAGKSALFNFLLGESRAIVTEIPGTTRDFISEAVVIRGVPFELIDTAGLRETGHVIEREGVRLSQEQIAEADVVVLVLDASRPDEAGRPGLPDQLSHIPAPVIVAANKVDLVHSPEDLACRPRPEAWISAETGAGIDELETRIVEAAVGKVCYCGGPMIFTERQRGLISAAVEACERGTEDFRKFLRNVTEVTDGPERGG